MVRTMFSQHKYVLCIVFLLLLTIILYGLAKAVIKMSFSSLPSEKEINVKEAAKTLNWTMYVPQIVMLLVAFIMGIYMPEYLVNLIDATAWGLN